MESSPKINFLLALWGESFISMFCDISLRSLLAPGNIPALAKEYKCIFTLLTKKENIPCFERQALYPLLKTHCEIRYVEIGDVIFPNNHSATLTVALERGMRESGDAMLSTYFIYLMADYLFAGNAFSGLLPHLRRGVSAVTAGNYQVVEEEILENVRSFINPATGIIDIPGRELVGWSLRHLHPVTVANTVNAEETHTLHANRLFWRVGEDTLIGRFYLRHTLCLKPERTDYIIGGPWDYSYLPEMCPSGNVAHITDSDEYFVIELQPLAYEDKYVAAGPHVPAVTAESLSEWTTAGQRANAHIAVTYHSNDVPPQAKAVIAQSGQYVASLEKMMAATPATARGHFYWMSCIQSIAAVIATQPKEYHLKVDNLNRAIWGSPTFSPPFTSAGAGLDAFPPLREETVSKEKVPVFLLLKWYLDLFGHLPAVHPWHPHFTDYNLLKQAITGYSGKVLFILPPKRVPWMEWSGPNHVLRSTLIMYRDMETVRAELQGFSACVIHLPVKYDVIVGKLFDYLLQVMPKGSDIHIFLKAPLVNKRGFTPAKSALHHMHLGQKQGTHLTKTRFHSSMLRRVIDKSLTEAGFLLLRNSDRPLKVLWFGAQLALLHAVYFIYNIFSILTGAGTGKTKNICSALLTFKVEP